MLDRLDRSQRLQLMQFVCSFAWADLQVRDEERAFVARMIERLELDDEEREQVRGWLERPPPSDGIDPTSIPRAHQRAFVEAIEGVIAADGEVAPEERESLAVLRDLLA